MASPKVLVEESARVPGAPSEGHIVAALREILGLHGNEAQERYGREKADQVQKQIEDRGAV